MRLEILTLTGTAWAVLTIVNLAWLLASVAVSQALGHRPVLAQLNAGPALLRFRLAGFSWRLCLVPFGAYTGFRRDEESDEETPLARAPLWSRLVGLYLPWAFPILFGVLHFGPERGLEHLLSGFRIPFELELLEGRFFRFFNWLREGRVSEAVAVLALKMTALNLLPLPILAGSGFYMLPLQRRFPELGERFMLAGFLVLMGWVALALYAIVRGDAR